MPAKAITEFCVIPDCGRHPVITEYALEKYDPKYIDRFFHQIDATGDCWTGPGNEITGGYLRTYFGKHRTGSTHRVMWECLIGEIPPKHEIDHRCYFTACINPDHLDAVPPKTNIKRTRHHNHRSKTHCKRGHKFTPENTYVRPGRPGRECWTCIRLRRST